MVSLRVESLYFGYREREFLLKNVNVKVEAGEVVCLLGPNGSGKSTLIKCIGNILRPQKGKILIGDKDVQKIGGREIAKIIGYLPQTVNIVPPLTVSEVVMTGRLPYIAWSPTKVDLEKVRNVMEIFGVEKWAWKPVNELSGGERQKVFLAAVFAKEPEIVLLDEPTNNLDLKHQLEVMEIIRNYAISKKAAVLVVVHDINLAARYADRILLMNGGEIIAEGDKRKALTRENIKRVFDINAEIVNVPKGVFIIPFS